MKPICLLADSRPLFSESLRDMLFSERVSTDARSIEAAYIGASNGDNPEFFSVFQAAMNRLGDARCRMIPSRPSDDDLNHLDLPDLILLAGGDTMLGHRIISTNGVAERVVAAYHQGSLLIGISAGAVQLGLLGWSEKGPDDGMIEMLGLVPAIVDVHQEQTEWRDLHRALNIGPIGSKGLAIPLGGGCLCSIDGVINSIGRSVYQITSTGAGHQCVPMALAGNS